LRRNAPPSAAAGSFLESKRTSTETGEGIRYIASTPEKHGSFLGTTTGGRKRARPDRGGPFQF